MSYDQYWHGDTRLVRFYREADRLRQKREDQAAWLHGLYVARAIDSTICNAFREEEREEYPDMPLTFETAEDRAAREAEKEKARLVAFLNGKRAEMLAKELNEKKEAEKNG